MNVELDLAGDVGGTNGRWGISTKNGLEQVISLENEKFAGPTEAIAEYKKLIGFKGDFNRARIAIAGPISDLSRHRMTNGVWANRDLNFTNAGIQKPKLINDFAGQAAATGALDRDAYEVILQPGRPIFLPSEIIASLELQKFDLHKLADEPDPDQRIVVLGPGTGLGVASAHINENGKLTVMGGEGSHIRYATSVMNDREVAIVKKLTQKFGQVSCETIGSGPGLVNAYNASRAVDREVPADDVDPARVVTLARVGQTHAVEAVKLFSGAIGQAASALGLGTHARGGAVLGGSIIQKMSGVFNLKAFEENIRRNDLDKCGSNFLNDTPVVLMKSDQNGIYGAHVYLQYGRN